MWWGELACGGVSWRVVGELACGWVSWRVVVG